MFSSRRFKRVKTFGEATHSLQLERCLWVVRDEVRGAEGYSTDTDYEIHNAYLRDQY